MKTPIFTMLIGMPGTGKSTWREKNQSPYEIVLSSDDHIERLCRKQGITYDQGFTQFIDISTKLVNDDFIRAINHRSDIIDDRTNLTVKSRAKKLNQLPDSYKKIAMVFQLTDREEWKKRLKRPGKSIPESILQSMEKTYESPTLEEGFDEVYIFDGEMLCGSAFSDK